MAEKYTKQFALIFAQAVARAMLARQIPPATRAALHAQSQTLADMLRQQSQSNSAAHAARSANAAKRRASQVFTVHWSATGASKQVTGWPALAKVTGLAVSTLRVQFSQGKGTLRRVLPDAQGVPNIAEITREPT